MEEVKTTQVCLVTGASSGIGRGIAIDLAKKNYRVVAVARRKERLEELTELGIDILPGDLTDNDFIGSIESYINRRYGECHILVNCAGTIEVGTIKDISIERMAAMMRLNVESTFVLTYRMLKGFVRQGFGHIINISSVLGTKVRPTAGAYAASKFAIEALSEALRMELSGTNIQVSCIEPGLVITELHKDWDIHPSESMNIKNPLHPDDIVRAVSYILDQPSHVRIPRLMVLPNGHGV